MRSKPKFNYPAFHMAAKRLRKAGWYVYNPAEMDIARDGGGPAMDMTIQQQVWHSADFRMARRYATRDLKVLTQSLRGEKGDAIVLLPGWQDSTGANAELAAAEWVNLRVLTIHEALNMSQFQRLPKPALGFWDRFLGGRTQ